MDTVPVPRRRGALGAAIASLLLVLSLTIAPHPVCANKVPEGTRGYEERAAVEKSARSRFRRLEITSLVLILVAGGAAILWAVRRK